MKRILSCLALFITFFLIDPAFIHAQTPQNVPPTYYINGVPVNDRPECFYYFYRNEKCPEPGEKYTPGENTVITRVDGTNTAVWISFQNLELEGLGDFEGSTKDRFYLCGFSDQDRCGSEDRNNKKNGFDVTKMPNGKGKIDILVCGDGPDAAKGVKLKQIKDFPGGIPIPMSPKDQRCWEYFDEDPTDWIKHKGCEPGRDYFHEGEMYSLGVYREIERSSADIIATFYVTHSNPLVKIGPARQGAYTTSPLTVYLWGRRGGGGDDNNYQVVVEGLTQKYKKDYCATIPNIPETGETVGINTQGIDEKNDKPVPEHILNGTGWKVEARPDSAATKFFFNNAKDKSNMNIGLIPGRYVVKINERTRDNRRFFPDDGCNGGHTYMHIIVEVLPEELKVLEVVYDPNNSDFSKILKSFPKHVAPCVKEGFDHETQECFKFPTAIGNIPTDAADFISKVFSIILGFGGLAATVIFILAGYKILTSQGNKEQLGEAREQITAAILGLLFIIFAFAILEIIGVDILRIPQFGR